MAALTPPFRFSVRLTPKGGRDAIDGWQNVSSDAKYLKARVRAVPEDGKANAALVALLAKAFAVPKSAVRIVSGATARMKIVEIEGDSETLAVCLASFGECK